MTKAEFIFWTYFKGSEDEKAAWQSSHQAFFVMAWASGHDAQNTDSELRVADPADPADSVEPLRLRVIDDMPSHVWVRPDGEAEVRWFDEVLGQYCRRDLQNPVTVSYNRFGKVKRKGWLNADGTLTEREFKD